MWSTGASPIRTICDRSVIYTYYHPVDPNGSLCGNFSIIGFPIFFFRNDIVFCILLISFYAFLSLKKRYSSEKNAHYKYFMAHGGSHKTSDSNAECIVVWWIHVKDTKCIWVTAIFDSSPLFSRPTAANHYGALGVVFEPWSTEQLRICRVWHRQEMTCGENIETLQKLWNWKTEIIARQEGFKIILINRLYRRKVTAIMDQWIRM